MSRKRTQPVPHLPSDPYESAKVAGLRYVVAEGRGIVRKRTGDGFSYIGPDGKPVTEEELARIRSLVIPPAWTDVWICPSKNGHIQAIGRDARGRKQYRYHALYRQIRDATKFGRMIAFAAALPKIREKVQEDLGLHGLSRRKVLATVVRLLETTGIRVGNDEYAKENNSFGLTTLRGRHVEISGRKLRFHFRGKSGMDQDIELTDRRLARIIHECRSLPGKELFHYLDEDGEVCRIHSEDVNEYLGEIAGEDFTAKDFRTWVGSGHAVLALEEAGVFESETAAKKNVVAAIKTVAAKLGNRPATCRKYYVHPAILDAYMQGSLSNALKSACDGDSVCALRREELAVLALIQTIDRESSRVTKAPDVTSSRKRSGWMSVSQTNYRTIEGGSIWQ